MTENVTTSPEWSGRIRELLRDLKLTQAGLAERLGVSPATVSRWMQGRHEPTAETYVALGNLAKRPEGVYFWERAGIDASGLPDASFRRAISSLRVTMEELHLIANSHVSRPLGGKGNAVAIPLLNVTAYGDEIPPAQNVSLSQAEMEDVLLAPLSWCPHPEHVIGMHVSGDSMAPVITDGSILFVDTVVVERELLNEKLVVVAHRDVGFRVARFERLPGADLLVSANHRSRPVDVSNASKWKIFGEVLWWVSRDTERRLQRPD